MCKAYGGEPSVDLLRAFLNPGHAGNWLTLSNRSGHMVTKAVTKPITHIKGWKGNFFYIENKIVHSEYPKLLLDDNKLDKKSFKDVILQHAQDDPLYYHISTYPCNVRTFPGPILCLAGLNISWKHSPKNPSFTTAKGMDFRSFMMEGIDGEFHFEPEGGVGDGEGSYLSIRNRKLGKCSKYTRKRKHIAESSGKETRQKARKVLPQASKTFDDPSDPLNVDSDPDFHEFPSAKELKDSIDCHWVVAHVTPPLWKQLLKEISLEKLCDIHDKAYMQQVVLDNVLNSKTRKLMSTLMKAKASCDVIRERERENDKAYAELEMRCNKALQVLDKNPLVLDMCEEIETLQGQVDKLHGEYIRLVLEEKKWINYEQTLVILCSKVEVAKVVPHVAMELVYSDKMGLLVARLAKTDLFHGRCSALEEIAALKEPFELEKMPFYHPLSKKSLIKLVIT
ncbi:hypothetical protein Tco_1243460 [Tanacetum coccineum]